jgi:hypothetical protein
MKYMATLRRGLGVPSSKALNKPAAPSGAKPRRIKGDWKKADENEAPNGAKQVGGKEDEEEQEERL